MSERFHAKKQEILNKLNRSDEDYTDASPKGSVDEGIRELVGGINRAPGFVTTSSCSGRIAVFLEGAPKYAVDDEDSTTSNVNGIASSGGKGGGRWLFTSHDLVALESQSRAGSIFEKFGFSSSSQVSSPDATARPQYVHFKFEPMILHILTSTPDQAQQALTAAMTAGFRESGISSLLDRKGRANNPMVAVRSAGLGMDCIVGFQSLDGGVCPMVSESYLRTIVQIANERLGINRQRVDRFRQAFLEEQERHSVESAVERKERKRGEGLVRQEVKNEEAEATTQNYVADEPYGLDFLTMDDEDV